MKEIEMDPDGYTSRPLIEMLNDPPEPESIDIRVTDIDRALTAKYGPGAMWLPAAPTSAKGAAPFWIDRWAIIWETLFKGGYTHKQQMDRFRQMADWARGLRDDARPDAQAIAIFHRLEAAARPPIAPGAPELPLWAVTTEAGLLLVQAPVCEIESLVDTRQAASMRQVPSGATILVRIDMAIEVPKDQATYWAWAAAQLGFLFGLPAAGGNGTDASKASKTNTPNVASVVRPEPPSTATPIRRR